MPPERRYWLDEPRNVDKVFYTLCAVCALLTLPDLVLDTHGHFAVESWFGFFGAYGFVGCVFLVLAAKRLRRWLMRDEDYYDD